MKRSLDTKKGFTLIELLVVVAIIGILAAVGVVAYSGYTSGAKASAAKSNYANVIKYITAEVTKCNLGETKVMSGNLACSGKSNAGTFTKSIIKATEKALKEFKNPHDTKVSAVVDGDGHVFYKEVGLILLDQYGYIIQVVSCYKEPCSDTSNRSPITQIKWKDF